MVRKYKPWANQNARCKAAGMVQLCMWVPEDLKAEAKERAAAEGVSLRQWIIGACEGYMKRGNHEKR